MNLSLSEVPLMRYFPIFLSGLSYTMSALCLSGLISISIGLIFGILTCSRLSLPLVSPAIKFYTFIAKGIPAYVHILLAYFVIPYALGIQLDGFTAGTLALGFCSSGYVTEIVRSSLNAVHVGQWDSCFTLGYSRYRTIKNIIMPQAAVMLIAPLCGELEQLVKSTSLLATIGVAELTRTGMNIISRELNPLPIWSMIALIYLCLSAIITMISMFLENNVHASKQSK